jgi:hypothetical protein
LPVRQPVANRIDDTIRQSGAMKPIAMFGLSLGKQSTLTASLSQGNREFGLSDNIECILGSNGANVIC